MPAKKFKKATSDSFTTIGENNATRPEAANLINADGLPASPFRNHPGSER